MHIKRRGRESELAIQLKTIVLALCKQSNRYIYYASERCNNDLIAVSLAPPSIDAFEIEAGDGRHCTANALRSHRNGATRICFVTVSTNIKRRIIAKLQRELTDHSEILAKTSVMTIAELHQNQNKV